MPAEGPAPMPFFGIACARRPFVILRRALFARRRTWASRAMRRAFCDAIIRAFGSHPYSADSAPEPLPHWNFLIHHPHYLRRPTDVRTISLPNDYTRNCEAPLHHRTHQGRHEVHLHPLRPPRQHSRLRRPRRQPPHPGRHRHQSPRHHRPPRARNVLLPRHPATHLAHLISAVNAPISQNCHPERSKPIRASRIGLRSRRTCCSPAAPQLMWRQPSSAVSGAKRRQASVERTLLSVASDLEVDLDSEPAPVWSGRPRPLPSAEARDALTEIHGPTQPRGRAALQRRDQARKK